MDPNDIETLFGKRCIPKQRSATNEKLDQAVLLTGSGGGRQHDSLEPHREEVHDGEVTECNQEIADPDEHGNFLLEQERCQHGLDGKLQFND